MEIFVLAKLTRKHPDLRPYEMNYILLVRIFPENYPCALFILLFLCENERLIYPKLLANKDLLEYYEDMGL